MTPDVPSQLLIQATRYTDIHASLHHPTHLHHAFHRYLPGRGSASASSALAKRTLLPKAVFQGHSVGGPRPTVTPSSCTSTRGGILTKRSLLDPSPSACTAMTCPFKQASSPSMLPLSVVPIRVQVLDVHLCLVPTTIGVLICDTTALNSVYGWTMLLVSPSLGFFLSFQ